MHAEASDMQRPLALLGGTFDPVHYGHLRAAWEAAEALAADVAMLPANVPPHRPPPRADARHRLAMLELALRGQERLRADARELQRSGPSYTYDTLLSFRDEIGNDRPLVLLVGEDAFAGLSGWHRWRELFGLAHVAVLARPGVDDVLPEELRIEVGRRNRQDCRDLGSSPAGLVARIEVTPLEISATALRDTLDRGGEPRYLMPDAVAQYIREHGLYAPRGGGSPPAAPDDGVSQPAVRQSTS